jgi:glycine betaine transporter
MNKIKKKDNTVFYVSLVLSGIVVLWGIIAKESFANFANFLLDYLTTNFGWAYLVSMFIFVIFALGLAFSKYGNIKLGPDDSKPEYSTTSWFGMLFGAGMGIGLVFWGVAEPISHFVSPVGADPGSMEAANFAMRSSFMHWGFHPWANYSIIGLALAYFQFRKNKPGMISSIFLPLIGEKGVNGPLGKLIDILAVFATVAGVATSLGLGTLQINSGLNFLFNLPETTVIQIAIILIITVLYIGTAVSGIDKGIKVLGDINLVLAFGLLLLTFILGPTLKIINSITNGFGQYMNNFISSSLHVEPFGDNGWLKGWTIFYWAWWIAWAPFVGTFIARISKGRTIREFIFGVMFAPALVSMVWFAVFGATGINLVDKIGVEGLSLAANNPATALFQVFSYYPLSKVLSIITVVLLGTFFITSANSATFVLGMFSSHGDLNPTTSKQVIWGVIQSLFATALLIAGGLGALQTASVAAAFPFIFIMLFAMVSLVKALKEEDSVKSLSDKK